ncbi:hypothetical protein NM208_g5824 [Fusarium decemcellulare]|uniref:Uncharacterized protein n=2 Tax=Fusarium decemcellulare TaxID=57161 RepID=A0ACC1SBI0_9HYPO|nr:hypothetical protein NM208_g6833 [Fusarium decemcellulare]KAJ3538625.1 hypothetical protein NM208_g5824 [Fusarium decemcellulare]
MYQKSKRQPVSNDDSPRTKQPRLETSPELMNCAPDISLPKDLHCDISLDNASLESPAFCDSSLLGGDLLGGDMGSIMGLTNGDTFRPGQDYPDLNNEMICYGMLSDVEVQMRRPPKSYQPVTRTSDGGKVFDSLQLELKTEHGLISIPDGQAVAVLNNKSFQAISSCMIGEHFQIDVWVLSTEWNTKVVEANSLGVYSKSYVRMKINIFLSGPRDAGNSVATSLGRFQAYLQPPHIGLFQYPYSNPQSLSLPESAFELQSTRLTTQLPNLEEYNNSDDEAQEIVEGNSTQIASLIMNIDTFLEDVPRNTSITRAPSDARIISFLFSHQQDAVNFMIRRETMMLEPGEGLWERQSLHSGEIYYQHRITGAKRKSAEEFSGGILADDMGLGKTLSTLAVIVTSMDRARTFSFNQSDQGKPTTRSKATIVIVPTELLINTWAREIERHIYPGTLHYIKYHGQDRRGLDKNLHQQDIILTTYGTVMAECRRGNSVLHRIDWYRMVLDEAHTVRNWSSKQFNAVYSISSEIRWCLTGTLIQNSLDDLGSLIKFLKMPIFSEPAIFRKYVAKCKHTRGSETVKFENLRLILSSICLRRNQAILPTHGYDTEDRRPAFTPQERDQYRSLGLACRRAILIDSKGFCDDKTHIKVMEALLRLRMFCNNGPATHDTSLSTALATSRPEEALSFLQQSGEAICGFCSADILCIGDSTNPDSGYLTPCWHVVCGECMQNRQNDLEDDTYICPFCNSAHQLERAGENPLLVRPSSGRQYPSKINCLVEDVQAHYLESKCIVFSFWKTTLDIVGSALEARGIKYLRVDGDVSPKKRNTILIDFQSKSARRVLIMTFSTGGVGLNGLTVANRVHILEPQWNPAVENQATGRVLRLDQQRRVTILAGGGFACQQDRREQKANQLKKLQEYLEQSDPDR